MLSVRESLGGLTIDTLGRISMPSPSCPGGPRMVCVKLVRVLAALTLTLQRWGSSWYTRSRKARATDTLHQRNHNPAAQSSIVWIVRLRSETFFFFLALQISWSSAYLLETSR